MHYHITLTLCSYGSEVTDESPAMLKELANSFHIKEDAIMTPEQSGALAASITIDILFTWLFIHFILNKISAWLKKKREWTAELETNDMVHSYEEKEYLKKAKYELCINLILGFVYFISSYFCLLLFIINAGGCLVQLAGISGYGFRALMKTRKESISIIDHILSEAYPEKKKSYQMLLTTIMLLFQFLLFWPLLIVICIIGFILYLFLLSLR